jgi:hypothetical protein
VTETADEALCAVMRGEHVAISAAILESVRHHNVHLLLAAQPGEIGALQIVEAGGEQMNVPQPEEIGRVLVVRDAVKARQK